MLISKDTEEMFQAMFDATGLDFRGELTHGKLVMMDQRVRCLLTQGIVTKRELISEAVMSALDAIRTAKETPELAKTIARDVNRQNTMEARLN